MELAPVLIFTYKRIDTLKRVISSLKENYLAEDTDLYIFSDSYKLIEDKPVIDNIRDYLQSIDGFKSITIYESESNKGLAKSIIEGVSKVIKVHSKVIVLEDDLITSRNFLNYMNSALGFYQNNKAIFSISGYSTKIKSDNESDIYFTMRSSSWGWATWEDRWFGIDWDVLDYLDFKNNNTARSEFNKMGSDLSSMLDKQMQGKINSWAIRWCYHQFKKNMFTVFPIHSKVKNIGIGESGATHTVDKFNRFDTTLDYTNNTNFKFDSNVNLNPEIIRQFKKPYTLRTRVFYKIINSLFGSFL